MWCLSIFCFSLVVEESGVEVVVGRHMVTMLPNYLVVM